MPRLGALGPRVVVEEQQALLATTTSPRTNIKTDALPPLPACPPPDVQREVCWVFVQLAVVVQLERYGWSVAGNCIFCGPWDSASGSRGLRDHWVRLKYLMVQVPSLLAIELHTLLFLYSVFPHVEATNVPCLCESPLSVVPLLILSAALSPFVFICTALPASDTQAQTLTRVQLSSGHNHEICRRHK